MDAKELFKTKAEVAAELDKLGVVYPKVKSGANEGKPTITFDKLCSLYENFINTSTEVDPIVVTPASYGMKLSFGRR